MPELAGLAYTIGLWATIICAVYVHKDDYYDTGWLMVVTSPFWPISWLVMLSISINLLLYKRYGYVNLMKFFKQSELMYGYSMEETENEHEVLEKSNRSALRWGCDWLHWDAGVEGILDCSSWMVSWVVLGDWMEDGDFGIRVPEKGSALLEEYVDERQNH